MIESRNKYTGDLDLETQKRNGNGTFIYPNSFFQYNGGWSQNIKHGKGILYMKDGGSFEGEFINGEINGKGVRKWANGSIYTGEFKEGEKHGYGEYISSTGEQYIGEWVYNQRNGKGKLIDCEGNILEGCFLNHKAEGECEIKYANGNFYKGFLSKGMKKGLGKFFNEVEKFEYEGEWDNDNRQGDGSFIQLERNYKYKGNWIDNYPEVLPNVLLLKFTNEEILEMQRNFEENKKDDKKKPKKQGEEEEIFRFIFPEVLEYEIGGPPLKTIEIHCSYQGEDILDPLQLSKEEIEELVKQYNQLAKKTKNPQPMPDYTKPKMMAQKAFIVVQESGREIIIELLKFNDLSKKNDMNPIDYKKFRVDYRDRIKEKREDNERLKEELQKQIELEAKQEPNIAAVNPIKKSPIKGKKEPKKEEVKIDDLNKVNLYNENEEEAKKPLILFTLDGIAKIENLEFPDDFPIGRYTFIINSSGAFPRKIEQITFDLIINPPGGDDKKKKKR